MASLFNAKFTGKVLPDDSLPIYNGTSKSTADIGLDGTPSRTSDTQLPTATSGSETATAPAPQSEVSEVERLLVNGLASRQVTWLRVLSCLALMSSLFINISATSYGLWSSTPLRSATGWNLETLTLVLSWCQFIIISYGLFLVSVMVAASVTLELKNLNLKTYTFGLRYVGSLVNLCKSILGFSCLGGLYTALHPMLAFNSLRNMKSSDKDYIQHARDRMGTILGTVTASVHLCLIWGVWMVGFPALGLMAMIVKLSVLSSQSSRNIQEWTLWEWILLIQFIINIGSIFEIESVQLQSVLTLIFCKDQRSSTKSELQSFLADVWASTILSQGYFAGMVLFLTMDANDVTEVYSSLPR